MVSLGMFVPSRAEPTGAEIVLGAGMAVTAFLPMLERHGAGVRANGYCDPYELERLAKVVRRAAGKRRPRVALHPTGVLLEPDALAVAAPDAWHDVNADVRRPFHVRAVRASRAYPISIAHHTVSYQHFLHDWYLALLLADVRPYDTIVCSSHAARRAIENVLDHVRDRLARAHGVRLRYPGRFDHIPLGVDTEVFRPRPRLATRRKLGLPADASIALWIGRFSAVDKADLLPLVGAFARVAKRARDGRPRMLVLAGTDRRFDVAYIQDYAARLGVARAVRCVGPLDAVERPLWFSAADVFVSPVDNIQESFGLTPIEAMACGVPAIVSDWDGYRETIVEGKTGFRIPTVWARCDDEIAKLAPVFVEDLLDHFALAQSVSVDPGVLEQRLEEMFSNPELCRRMGEQARRRAVAVYSWPRVIRQHVELWRELGRIAGKRAFRPRPAGRYLIPPFVDAFGHFASELVDEGRLVVATALGQATLVGDEPMPVYRADGFAVREPLLEAALARIVAAGPGGTPLRRLITALPGPPDRVVRHVLWLLKYGLAQVPR